MSNVSNPDSHLPASGFQSGSYLSPRCLLRFRSRPSSWVWLRDLTPVRFLSLQVRVAPGLCDAGGEREQRGLQAGEAEEEVPQPVNQTDQQHGAGPWRAAKGPNGEPGMTLTSDSPTDL